MNLVSLIFMQKFLIGRNGQPFKRFDVEDAPFAMEDDIKLLLNYNPSYAVIPPTKKPTMTTTATSPR